MEWQDRLLDFLQLLLFALLFSWAPELQARYKSPSLAPPKSGPGSFPEPRYPPENVFETEEDLARHVDLHTIRGNLPSGAAVDESKAWEVAEEPLEDGSHLGTPPPAPRRARNEGRIPKAQRRERPPGYDHWAIGQARYQEKLERNRMIEEAERKRENEHQRLIAPQPDYKALGKTTAGSSTINTPAGAQETTTEPRRTIATSGNNLIRPTNASGSGQGEQQTAPKKNLSFAAGNKIQDGNLNPTDTASSGQGEQQTAPKNNPSFAAGNKIQDSKPEGSAKIESEKTTARSGNNHIIPTNITGSGQGDRKDTPKKNVSFAAGTKVEDGKLDTTANENGSFKPQVGPLVPNIAVTDDDDALTGALPTANNTTTVNTANPAETQTPPFNPLLGQSDEMVSQMLRNEFVALSGVSSETVAAIFDHNDDSLKHFGRIFHFWSEWTKQHSDPQPLASLGVENVWAIYPNLVKVAKALDILWNTRPARQTLIKEISRSLKPLGAKMEPLWEWIRDMRQQKLEQRGPEFLHDFRQRAQVQANFDAQERSRKQRPAALMPQMNIEQTTAVLSIPRPQPLQQCGQQQQGQYDTYMEQTPADPSIPELQRQQQNVVEQQQAPTQSLAPFSQTASNSLISQTTQQTHVPKNAFAPPTPSDLSFAAPQPTPQAHVATQDAAPQSQPVFQFSTPQAAAPPRQPSLISISQPIATRERNGGGLRKPGQPGTTKPSATQLPVQTAPQVSSGGTLSSEPQLGYAAVITAALKLWSKQDIDLKSDQIDPLRSVPTKDPRGRALALLNAWFYENDQIVNKWEKLVDMDVNKMTADYTQVFESHDFRPLLGQLTERYLHFKAHVLDKLSDPSTAGQSKMTVRQMETVNLHRKINFTRIILRALKQVTNNDQQINRADDIVDDALQKVGAFVAQAEKARGQSTSQSAQLPGYAAPTTPTAAPQNTQPTTLSHHANPAIPAGLVNHAQPAATLPTNPSSSLAPAAGLQARTLSPSLTLSTNGAQHSVISLPVNNTNTTNHVLSAASQATTSTAGTPAASSPIDHTNPTNAPQVAISASTGPRSYGPSFDAAKPNSYWPPGRAPPPASNTGASPATEWAKRSEIATKPDHLKWLDELENRITNFRNLRNVDMLVVDCDPGAISLLDTMTNLLAGKTVTPGEGDKWKALGKFERVRQVTTMLLGRLDSAHPIATNDGVKEVRNALNRLKAENEKVDRTARRDGE